MRCTGTKFIGIRGPIVKNGDDIEEVFLKSLKDAVDNGETTVDDKDVFGITESVVARSQGNYVTADDVASSVRSAFRCGKNDVDHIGLIFPIMSRNRFSIILRGIARAARHIDIFFKVPCDEVGNRLCEDYFTPGVITEEEYIAKFGKPKHKFTGVNYFDLYRKIANEEHCDVDILCASNLDDIEAYYYRHGYVGTTGIIYCGIHDRQQSVSKLKETADDVISLADICSTPLYEGMGYNNKYGVLGSNKADEETLKLFPVDCFELCGKIKQEIKNRYGKLVEVMVYGDGCFKDPVGGIWELADPVTTPGYTKGLEGTPEELKLKYLADNDFKDCEDAEECIRMAIIEKDNSVFSLKGDMKSQGTTPRRYIDLLASAFDLTSGSGDKGTPFVQAKGYFDNYADS